MMLDVLQRILREVNAASDLQRGVEIIVGRVAEAMGVDVCSVYLIDPESRDLVLMGTRGLAPASVGQVRIKAGEGLVGLVAARAELVNVENAPEHPNFRYFPETGEERYRALLGAPIIHQRTVKGVLVVQQQQSRRFSDEDESLLVTLAAQLSGAIAHAEVSGGIDGLNRAGTARKPFTIDGLSGASGVAVGHVRVVYPHADLAAVPDRLVEDSAPEMAAFEAAVAAVRAELRVQSERLDGAGLVGERALFDAYLLILSGDTLVSETCSRIRAGHWAAGALRQTIEEHAALFEQMEDAYLRERASDLRDLGRRILMRLQDSGPSEEESWPAGTILVGTDLSASQLAEIPPGRLAGIVSSTGSSSSHVAILAQGLGIPAVLGVRDLPVGRMDGERVIVDGYQGRIYVRPTAGLIQEFRQLASEDRALAEGLVALQGEPSDTLDGVHMPLLANTGLASDLAQMRSSGAEGVGLYRTEIPFLMRDRFPPEEEQVAIYREALVAFDPAPVTLRTLDVGGDKPLSYFPISEDNPFLGWRGIRLTLDHPEIFLTQLRAMLRADVGLGNLQLLLPMVTGIEELEDASRLIDQALEELRHAGMAVRRPPVGVMIEVPAAVYRIDTLAARADFISIGSNDLVQYLLAVDRNNSRVADLYDALHPAVVEALRQVIDGTHRQGRKVSLCGEMAAQPAAALLLLGLGIDQLSMSAASMPRIKWVIRSFTTDQARRIAAEALQLGTGREVREHLNGALEAAGLGGLVRPGK